jgi:pantoate--beta-alanine ligase
MKILKTVKELNTYKKDVSGNSLGFVPTMGALHRGHASLFKTSVEQNEKTLVSIFVNSKQFNDKKDFLSYPKTIDEDLTFCDNFFLKKKRFI